MKRYIFLFFVFILAGCSSSLSGGNIKEYNNSLMAVQSQSVEIIKNYYEGLEKNYDGSNLLEMFTGTVEELQGLESKVELMSGWKDDYELRDAVANYISGLQVSFIKNEWPIVEMLLDYTGQVSRFYRDNESFFSDSAMKFAGDLAALDKEMESYYVHFSEKYGYK